MAFLGLDIGGANLKAADASGRARSMPFEIWRTPEQLDERIRTLLAEFPATTRLAITLTAELADCFETKSDGVGFIVRQAAAVLPDQPLLVWSTRRGFVSAAEACREPLEVAAANWHALATWAGRLAPEGTALLVDIGSTTTDIIPLENGVPCPTGTTDVGRLLSGELLYAGVRRTPLCALAQQVPFRNRMTRVAAELFATTLDVYLLLGRIPEDPSDCGTANGKPATVAWAHDRLARLLCGDRDEISRDEVLRLAEFFAQAQRSALHEALATITARFRSPVSTVIFSGSGEFLAREFVGQHPSLQNARRISLGEQLSPEVTGAACAYAVAVLAEDRTTSPGGKPTTADPLSRQ